MKGHSITIEQLRQMEELRAKGLSNSKIALEMGLSYVSVRRHLGAQKEMLRARPGEIRSHVYGKSFVYEEPKVYGRKPSSMELCGTITKYESKKIFYVIDNADNTIEIATKDIPYNSLHFTYQEFENFFSEIAYLHNQLYLLSQKPQTL